MPKRKRNAESSFQDTLTKNQTEVARALKAAKGFERQRLSKRLHEAGLSAEKKERLEREVVVLKSLDLHQTARAHLFSSLLKVKAIAASPDLPDEIRNGVPKPELEEEERAALHNVTSGLYNRQPVKDAVSRAVEAVCGLLNVPTPSKGKNAKTDKRKEKEEQPVERISSSTAPTPKKVDLPSEIEDGEDEDATDFEGFSDDEVEPEPSVSGDEEGSEEDEDGFAKYDHLLGSSSDEDDEDQKELYERYRGREKVNLDDISLSGSASEREEDDLEEDDDDDDDEDEEKEEEGSASDSSSSPPPPPAKKKKRSKEDAPPARPTNSTFLPSLMGGYISGSESASDVDVAAPKKRRGQRARQAIWEKKFGTKAKHLQSQGKSKGGRDAGWDMRRGAVDGDDQGGRRTPWKTGVSNPLRSGANMVEVPAKPPKPVKRDDEGHLHPSWQAAKKAKEQKVATFSGAKIVFD